MRSIKERNERMSKREREHEEKWKVKEVDVQVSETCRTCPYLPVLWPV
jgi:sulfatase maturation enzyme AslB (radical SAM superfamily)